ncbi:MAG: GDSL-type esterase/lipase family protein [Oscillospiraceae bacterium]|nr:GDSL-type esterase/lipase family protein [Oscillospiraceae bacterium]
MRRKRIAAIGAAVVLPVLILVWVLFIRGNAPRPIVYIALGDSIAQGYALDNPEQEGYAGLFAGMIQDADTDRVAKTANLAAAGLTTDQLLDQLTSPGIMTDELESATLITLSIGGNNVLVPTISLVQDFLEGFLGVNIDDITNINDILTLSPYGVLELVGMLPEFSFTEQEVALLLSGTDDFARDFPEIISIIKSTAPDAEIIVSTIYNPIPAEIPLLREQADEVISRMNAVITASAAEFGYKVADVYTAFNEAEYSVVNMNINPFAGDFSYDIHPNTEGHALIAQIHYELLEEAK